VPKIHYAPSQSSWQFPSRVNIGVTGAQRSPSGGQSPHRGQVPVARIYTLLRLGMGSKAVLLRHRHPGRDLSISEDSGVHCAPGLVLRYPQPAQFSPWWNRELRSTTSI